MHSLTTFAVRLAATAVAVGGLVLPSAAQAQDLPSYARPSYASDEETIHGRIQSINGTFNISVRDDRGFLDNVELHQGTIINPTGLTLSEGMSVTIAGHNTGSTFAANEIDTPYHYAGPVPEPLFYGPGWWYPGFAYGYGPSFGLTFVFGTGYVHGPFYPYYRGGYYHEEYFRAYDHRYLDHAYVRPAVARVPQAFAGRTFAGDGYRSRIGETRGYDTTTRGYAQPARGYATSRGYAPASRGYAPVSRGYAVARGASAGTGGSRGAGGGSGRHR